MSGRAQWARRPHVLSGALLVAVIGANLAGQALIYEPVDAIRCLNPLSSRACVEQLRDTDRISAAKLSADESQFVNVDRAQPYIELRRHSPEATYTVVSPVPHVWRVSPTLLATAGDAADVEMLDPRLILGITKVLGEDLEEADAAEISLDLAAGSNRYRLRLVEGSCREILAYDAGRQMVYIDMALLPEDLARQLRAARHESTTR